MFHLSLLTVLLFLDGCAVESMTAIKTDPSMPVIKNVKTLVGKTSVGFEWSRIHDERVKGILVYRAEPQRGNEQRYVKIATIDNRYATHYVNTTIRAGREYLYTFKTYGILYASMYGDIVRVKTALPFPAVEFAKAYLADSGAVKILWRPHSDPRIHEYIIERRAEGNDWKFLAIVKGRLSPEYVDTSAAKGVAYVYRISGRSADGVRTLPRETGMITVR
jgi:fibronectin type 3 domain-containing protein